MPKRGINHMQLAQGLVVVRQTQTQGHVAGLRMLHHACALNGGKLQRPLLNDSAVPPQVQETPERRKAKEAEEADL